MRYIFFFTLLITLLVVGIWLLTPSWLHAQPDVCPPGTPEGTVCLKNPLGFINVDQPRRLVEVAAGSFAAIIGAVAIAFIVFNAFKLVVASNEESITEAKEGLKWSVGGFLVAILSFTVISSVANLIGFNPAAVSEDQTELRNPIFLTSGNPNSFIDVMNFIMVNFLGLIGLATILMIIYYGYRYITSAGNEEAVTKAKEGLKWAITGFILALLAFTIIAGVRLLFPFEVQPGT